MPFAWPPPLRPGDPVAVVAPSGRPDPADLERGVALLAERYEVRTVRDLARAADGMTAGPDADRAAELAWALTDPEVRAVLPARGGYGLTRVLDMAMLEGLRKAPRLVVGFSDLTALLAGAARVASLVAVHGPMVCQIGRRGKEALDPLVALLERSAPLPAFDGLEPLAPGRAAGPVLGGNLTVLCHLVGTPLCPELAGAILFLEDVGERPYRIDRCLTHLEKAGLLAGLAGVAVGQLVGCDPVPPEHPAARVLEDRLGRLGVPVVVGLPAGHGSPNLPLPLGARAVLDADEGTLLFDDP